MTKVLIYSDCPVFGGADNLLIHLLGPDGIGQDYDVSFLYRHNRRFAEGVENRIRTKAAVGFVRFPERLEWIEAMERVVAGPILRKAIKIALRLVDYPLFLYELAVLTRRMARVRPQLVHINNGGYPGALGCRAAAIAARLAGARRVLFNANNMASELRLPWEALDWVIDRLVGISCDLFITASASAGAALARRGFSPELIRQIPNAVRSPERLRSPRDLRRELGLAEGRVAVVMTAFFEERKGHAILLSALEQVRRRSPGTADALEVLLVGDGPLRGEVEARARRLGLSGRVRFLGYRGDVLDIMNAADAVALPSISHEDMPYAVLEAMALGKPVVSTRVAGIPEAVEDGVTGLLVKPGDAEGLAAALLRLTSDAAERAAMGRAGRARFLERFEAGTACRRYREVYAELLAGAGATAPTGKPRVLLYSDCPVFGGADNLLVHLLGEGPLAADFDLELLFRHNRRFAEGVERRIRTKAPVSPIRFPDRHDWIEAMERRVRSRVLRKAVKIVFRLVDYGLYLYELAALSSAFRRRRPDIVHINNGGYPGALGCRAAAVAARVAGARRVIFNVNSTALKPRLPWEVLDLAIDRLVIGASDVFITASEAAGRALARRGFPRARIGQIPNAVRAPQGLRAAARTRRELSVPEGSVLFSMIAFFESLKGHRVLLHALRILKTRHPRDFAKVHVLFIGEGSERQARRDEAEGLGILPHLSFLGYRTDALDLLAASDGLILPSTSSEDMPYSILEAMALSKPVVGSRIAGIPEMIEGGVTGLLVPPGDAENLATALLELLRDPELRRRMGAEGHRRFASRFEASVACERYRELYRSLLERPAAAPENVLEALEGPMPAAGRIS